MITPKEAFSKVVESFPRFTNIRRRKDKSNLGKVIQSITEELDSVYNYYKEYSDSFFLINYVGKEDTVIDYLYVAQVGNIDIDDTVCINPTLLITDNIETFTKYKDEFAYYKDGYLFVTKKYESITYTYKKAEYIIYTELKAIWNIFDEYAMYFGIERGNKETNKELLTRILNYSKRRPNSTEEGLKNAILNCVNDSDLKSSDINIASIDAETIHYEDDYFGDIGNKLQYFNADTIRNKKWGSNYWEHNFKTLDYAPVYWNKELKYVQDGVGYNNSLKVDLLSDYENTPIDITADFYEKSLYFIKQYIRNNKVPISVKLNLLKYSNLIKPQDINYKIVASEIKDITNDNIYVECYESSYGLESFYIQDLLINKSEVLDITNPVSKLKNNTQYKLIFSPVDTYSDMSINTIDIIKDNITDSLIKENNYFKLDGGILKDVNTLLHVNNLAGLYSYTNFKDCNTGITLTDSSLIGDLCVDISGKDNKYLVIKHSCERSSLVNDIVYDNFIIDSNHQVFSDKQNASFDIDIQANSFYLSMKEGNCSVVITVDGETTSEIWYSAGKNILIEKDHPVNIKIKVTKLGTNNIIFDKIEYNHYEITKSLKTGNIINTSFGEIVPKTNDAENKLLVKIKSYTSYRPVIEYIHLGSKTRNNYETEIFTTSSNNYLNIKSNCNVSLIELDDDYAEVSRIDNYKTVNTYTNNKYSSVNLYLNIDDIGTDLKCSPQIKKDSIGYYIELKYGENIESISVEGYLSLLKDNICINKLLNPENNKTIYIAKNIDGFIVKDSSGEKIVNVKRSDISLTATKFITRCSDNLSVNYKLYDALINNIICDKKFDELIIHAKDIKTHVAYNTKSIYSNVTKTDIVNMFSPLLEENRLYCYKIDNLNKNINIVFDNNNIFSIGKKSIIITSSIDLKNTENYLLEINDSIDNKFVLSNEIQLEEQYNINGLYEDLAEFIIDVDSSIDIKYNKKTTEEIVFVEDDLFKKLIYSNIININSITINNTVIDPSKYFLIDKEGLILWYDTTLVGSTAIINYDYKVPTSIVFNDINYLYKLVDYNVNAYKKFSSLVFKNITDSVDVSKYDEIKKADKIMITTSNPNYIANIINNTEIRINKISEDNNIAVRPGFYYENGIEYYFFINPFSNKVNKLENITLVNVDVYDNRFTFYQQSANFLPDSAMYPNKLKKVCDINFNNKRISGISKIGKITACDSYDSWRSFNLDISLASGVNGLSLNFTSIKEDNYAYLDISDYINKNSIISLKNNNLNIGIAKESTFDNMKFSQSDCLEILSNEFINSGNYEYIKCEDFYDDNIKYYLVIYNTKDGWIDDIIIKDYIAGENIEDIHVKNIDKLGFDITEEKVNTNLINIDLHNKYSQSNNILIDENCNIKNAANIAWDMTNIYKLRSDFENVIRENLTANYDCIYSEDVYGYFITEAIYIRNINSLKNINIKVNDLIFNNFSGVNISVYTSQFEDGEYELIDTGEMTNILRVIRNKLKNFIKVKVSIPPRHYVNSLEVYTIYKETNEPILVSNYKTGSISTGIIDLDNSINFKVNAINLTSNNNDFKLYIRGLRKNTNNNYVWTNFKEIILDNDFKVTNDIEFANYRYFQIKIELLKYDCEIMLDSITLGVF